MRILEPRSFAALKVQYMRLDQWQSLHAFLLENPTAGRVISADDCLWEYEHSLPGKIVTVQYRWYQDRDCLLMVGISAVVVASLQRPDADTAEEGM